MSLEKPWWVAKVTKHIEMDSYIVQHLPIYAPGFVSPPLGARALLPPPPVGVGGGTPPPPPCGSGWVYGWFGGGPGSSWLPLAPPGSSWLPLAPLCSSWLLLAPPGSSWLLLAPPGSSWLLLAPPGSSCPSPPASPGSFWLPLAPPSSSWVPLAPPSPSQPPKNGSAPGGRAGTPNPRTYMVKPSPRPARLLGYTGELKLMMKYIYCWDASRPSRKLCVCLRLPSRAA